MFSTKNAITSALEATTNSAPEGLVGTSLNNRKKLVNCLWILATFLVVLTITACGSTPIINPGNQAPVISDFTVTTTDFRTGRVTANVSDPDGSLTTVKVDWGDGSTTNDTSGAASMNANHIYSKAQSYTVTLTIIDDGGESAVESKSLSIEYPAERCVGIKGINFCAQFSGDFKHVRVYAQILGEEINFFTLEDGKSGSAFIPPTGIARLLGTFNASAKTLKLDYQGCLIPYVASTCKTITSQTIRF